MSPATTTHTRHSRDQYYVVGEGIFRVNPDGTASLTESVTAPPNEFSFSRIGPRGTALDNALAEAVAVAMTGVPQQVEDTSLPAGYTYLGQFVDHDLTRMTSTNGNLVSQRSPLLDLDVLYGDGPGGQQHGSFYNGIRLRLGTTQASPTNNVPNAGNDLEGFDLPRNAAGATPAEKQLALIPDLRNDENLIVAQTHLAFMRFHNRVADTFGPRATFKNVRAKVVKHYQWMLRTDFLPRIVEGSIVEDVFQHGRRFFERQASRTQAPTMPLEFSVAAFRLGHSMIRDNYQWNRVFKSPGPDVLAPGSLGLLFSFSGTSGTLQPPHHRLPTNWVADFRRLFRFSAAGRPDLAVPDSEFNPAMRIDASMVDPLRNLPAGSFGPPNVPAPPAIERNLAFRNLRRANMVELASGQQMANMMGSPALSAEQILRGAGGATPDFSTLTIAQKTELTTNTPLWLYILREAEINGGKLTGVGGRIVAEVFHRAIEASRDSILRDKRFRPTLGPNRSTFRMTDLLLFAFEGRADWLNPLG
ncbi:MAG: peroxidase family protein [Acidobacteriota bacterium]